MRQGVSLFLAKGLHKEPGFHSFFEQQHIHMDLGGTLFQRAGPAIEKAHFQNPDRWHDLIKGSRIVPIRQNQVSQADAMEDRRFPQITRMPVLFHSNHGCQFYFIHLIIAPMVIVEPKPEKGSCLSLSQWIFGN